MGAMASDIDRDLELNELVARQFDEAADLHEARPGESYRIRAYRRGADALRRLDEPVRAIYEEQGLAGLIDLPGIGYALARAIVDVIELGRWRWLDHLRGDVDPEAVFATVAGIGPTLAHRIHEDLHLDHLEDLEAAAHDGRLATVPGFGETRVRAVRESLQARLAGRSPRLLLGGSEPPVADLVDIDREYRRRAEAGDLPRITPRRFNPTRRRWLPVLHTRRGGSSYTAMYSNTARAHDLGHTRDWVVIYADGPEGGRWTVVTETSGLLKGRRVVRGRESELTPARLGQAAMP